MNEMNFNDIQGCKERFIPEVPPYIKATLPSICIIWNMDMIWYEIFFYYYYFILFFDVLFICPSGFFYSRVIDLGFIWISVNTLFRIHTERLFFIFIFKTPFDIRNPPPWNFFFSSFFLFSSFANLPPQKKKTSTSLFYFILLYCLHYGNTYHDQTITRLTPISNHPADANTHWWYNK